MCLYLESKWKNRLSHFTSKNESVNSDQEKGQPGPSIQLHKDGGKNDDHHKVHNNGKTAVQANIKPAAHLISQAIAFNHVLVYVNWSVIVCSHVRL